MEYILIICLFLIGIGINGVVYFLFFLVAHGACNYYQETLGRVFDGLVATILLGIAGAISCGLVAAAVRVSICE